MKKQLFRTLVASCSLALSASFLAAPSSNAATLYDTDGDGLSDYIETHGYDYNRDGTIDIDFPRMGADPLKKDIFVEMDYMEGLLPAADELDQIVDIFSSYPVRNPNGTLGINLHLDAGNARGSKYDLGGGSQVPYSELPNGVLDITELRKTHSDQARQGLFHYMVWGDKYGTNGSSGQAYVGGLDFLVSVGPSYWSWAQDIPSVRIGTFVHEFGHNLGIHHGGNDSVNFKPNYLSVMNYEYQISGIPKADGTRYFGYSTRTMPTLNENSLDETRGFGASARGFLFSNQLAHKALDLNQDGQITSGVQADLNGDGQYTALSAPNDLTILRFQARAGAAAGLAPTPTIESNELTSELALQRNLIP